MFGLVSLVVMQSFHIATGARLCAMAGCGSMFVSWVLCFHEGVPWYVCGERIHLARRFSSCMRGVDETIQLIGIRSSQSVLSRLAFERSVVDISCGSFALRRRDTPGRSCVSLLIYIAPTISFTHHFHSHHTVSISHHHSSGQTR